MSEISGTYTAGHVKLDTGVDWPDGSRVVVVPAAEVSNPQQSALPSVEGDWGFAESEYQDTPEFRAKLIAQMDRFEPLELSPAQEAEWKASSGWIKEHTIEAVRKQMGL